jgi:hypothetical protein
MLLNSLILAWTPFLNPLPLWNDSRWPWLIIPLCAGVSIVYKSIKCASMKSVPREAASITLVCILVMATAAFALAALVRFLES